MQGTIGKSNYGSYTYVGLNTDLDENLHIFSRTEGTRATYQLVQMIKPKGKDFKKWKDPFNGQMIRHRVLVNPNRSLYVAYRQKVAMDQNGNLYLHFKYWPNQLYPNEASIFKLTPSQVFPPCDSFSNKYCFYPDSMMPYLYSTTLKTSERGESFTFFAAQK